MQAAFGVQFKAYRIPKTKQTFRGRIGTDKRSEGPSQYRRERFRSRQSAAGYAALSYLSEAKRFQASG